MRLFFFPAMLPWISWLYSGCFNKGNGAETEVSQEEEFQAKYRELIHIFYSVILEEFDMLLLPAQQKSKYSSSRYPWWKECGSAAGAFLFSFLERGGSYDFRKCGFENVCVFVIFIDWHHRCKNILNLWYVVPWNWQTKWQYLDMKYVVNNC